MKNVTDGKVTAAIVFRDAARTLTKCLDSICNQCDEIITLNDRSSDYGADIISDRGYSITPNYDSQKTVGQLRHELAGSVSTEFVFFQDADDVRLPNTVRFHIDVMIEHKLDMLITPFKLVPDYICPLSGDVISDIVNMNIHTSALYFRTEAFLGLEPIAEYAWEYLMTYAALMGGLKIGYDHFYSQIWSGPGIIGGRNKKDQRRELLKLFNTIKDENKLDPIQYNYVCKAIQDYDRKEELQTVQTVS